MMMATISHPNVPIAAVSSLRSLIATIAVSAKEAQAGLLAAQGPRVGGVITN
jgi:hypothetical protein